MATFPDYPGIKIDIKRKPFFGNTVVEGESGLEQVTNWISQPRWRYELQIEFLRVSVDEVRGLLQFIDDHRGSLRSFYITDPHEGLPRLVRFDQDDFDFVQIVDGVWEVPTLNLVSVT
jgi:hypothetical protein